MRKTLIFATAVLIASCNQEAGTDTPTITPTDTAPPKTVPASSTAERDAWQKPQEIFNLMGNDFRGQTIADLAARDGYFTFKLIEVGANVIAIDDDPANIAALETRKKELGLTDERLKIRLGTIDDPKLAKDEVDAALLVHGLVRVPNKREYLAKIFAGTREPRPLFIVEWLNAQTPLGPPMTDRMSSEAIMDEVGLAGYTDVGAYSAKIPYQVFLFASYQVGMPEDMEGIPQDGQMMPVPSQ